MAVPMKLVGLGLLGIGLFVMIVDSDYKKKVANEPQDPFFGKNGSKAFWEMGDAKEFSENFSYNMPFAQKVVDKTFAGLHEIKTQDDAAKAAAEAERLRLLREKKKKDEEDMKKEEAWLLDFPAAPTTGGSGFQTPQPRPNLAAPGNPARGGVGSFAAPAPVTWRRPVQPTTQLRQLPVHPDFPIGAATIRRPAHFSRATGGNAGRTIAQPTIAPRQIQPVWSTPAPGPIVGSRAATGPGARFTANRAGRPTLPNTPLQSTSAPGVSRVTRSKTIHPNGLMAGRRGQLHQTPAAHTNLGQRLRVGPVRRAPTGTLATSTTYYGPRL